MIYDFFFWLPEILTRNSDIVPEFTFGTGLHFEMNKPDLWMNSASEHAVVILFSYCLYCVWILNFQSFLDLNFKIPFVSEVIGFFLQFIPIVWYDVYLKKKNPPTYRPIGEMEGRVQETNIFLRVA